MKKNISIYQFLLICTLLSYQSLNAQQKNTDQIRKNILSIGINYSFIPQWKSHSIYNPQLSYERTGIGNKFSIWFKINAKIACTQCNTDYIIPGSGASGIQLLPSQNIPTDIRHQSFSLYAGVSPIINPRYNLKIYVGPIHRRGTESYFLGYSFNGTFYEVYNDSRQAEDWGLGTALKYRISLSQLLEIALIVEYQFYVFNTAEENYNFQPARQEVFVGVNLGIKF